jgi:ribosomal-protein-alanine N-acetyltransferase
LPGGNQGCGRGVIVRTATRKDIEKIYSIEVASFAKPYPLPYLELLLSLTDYYLVADMCGNIVGYVIGVIVDKSVCHILSIAVHPAHRRCKYGSVLLQSILELCCRGGATTAMLEVEYTNFSAQLFYHSHGFVEATMLPDYYGPKRHGLVMVSLKPCIEE